MLFPTLTFAVFFALVYPVCWLLRWRDGAWKVFVLGASYYFYGSWDRRFVLLIFASSVVNTLLARRLARRTRNSDAQDSDALSSEARSGSGWSGDRAVLVLAVGINLIGLGVFKYYGFFVESLNAMLRLGGAPGRLPFVEVIVPVGISFFTFQAISYLVDVYHRRVSPAPWLDVAVYLTFFPHLVAGPIVRATEFLPQLRLPRALPRRTATRAALLICQGLFKKVVISSYVATTVVDPVFGVPGQYSALEIIVAVYGYAVQIYADFSGYTDMAIGIALLLGITFPQNFDRPYVAVSLRDFWRRWHMTLSRWLRDYLYIPLGGSRRGEWRAARNIFLTMTLGGLWHGASLNFLAWGVFHGALLALERVGRRWLSPPNGGWRFPLLGHHVLGHPLLGRLLTFHVVCVGWVLFRADSLATAGELLQRSITSWGPAPAVTAGPVAVIAAALALQALPPGWAERFEAGFAELPLPVQGVALGTFFALVVALGPAGVAPFIYYQF